MIKKIYLTIIIGMLIFSSQAIMNSPFGSINNRFSPALKLVPEGEEDIVSEQFGPAAKKHDIDRITRSDEIALPRNTLVLMVEFPNNKYSESLINKDYLADPKYTVADYIERHMFHLQSYYLDVSKNKYNINYVVLDTLIMLDNEMEYYGDSSRSLARRVRLVRETISKIDSIVDFSEYDSFVIFHSGAGSETDVYGENPNTISSSFINRRLFQAVMDPENDDYPGLKTKDGVYIKEVIVFASHQNHKNAIEETNYSGYGLLCYLFGRQIGMPTLFGNVSSLGKASGAGNFCIMGTGAWNASGFVPPYLSAWLRYYMGWEKAKKITSSVEDNKIDYPFKLPFVPQFVSESNPPIPRLYKIPIREINLPHPDSLSEGIKSIDEYYLIENREQNPDGAMLGKQPRFTFQLLPDGEQDYYEAPYQMVPRFNFMKNTYRGCDWDFYLPGYGNPDVEALTDGSGLLIWHIDEKIISEKLADNTINSDPNHQGVTLIEADGIQHLRSSIPDALMRGSPEDAFRKGNNDYFGKKIKDDGTISIPFVESYYGNVELEIYDISVSGPEMTFSVNFGEVIDYGYEGSDAYPLGVVKSQYSNKEMIFVPTKSGKVFWQADGLSLPVYPLQTDSIPHLYAYSPEWESFFVPTQSGNATEKAGSRRNALTSKLMKFSQDGCTAVFSYDDYEWATHPLIINGGVARNEIHLAIAIQNDEEAKIILYDKDFEIVEDFDLTSTKIIANMMYKNGFLYFVSTKNDEYYLNIINLSNLSIRETKLSIDKETNLTNNNRAILAPITKKIAQEGEEGIGRRSGDSYEDNVLLLTEDSSLYLFAQNGNVCAGFPVHFDDPILSVPIVKDVTANGFLDIILVGENALYVVNYAGEVRQGALNPANSPSAKEKAYGLGAIIIDSDNNGKYEIIASMGANSLTGWDNNCRLLNNYPQLMQAQPIHSPVITKKNEQISILLGTVNGKVLRRLLPEAKLTQEELNNLWNSEYTNLQRVASYSGNLPTNSLESTDIFIKDRCYAFPSPLTYDNGGILYFNIMVGKDTPVEIKVFDISGKLVFQDKQDCKAYVDNRNKVKLKIKDLSTGVYFALLKGGNSTIEIRFAVEK